MNRIILAYAPENAAIADALDRALSRIGIPFEHAQSQVAAQISAAGEPVLLLLTDNFLKNRHCVEGLLPVLQNRSAGQGLLVVTANGVDAAGHPVPTQIERMANMLHYMNHWQNVWLGRSDQAQQTEGAHEKAQRDAELDALRGIANQMGDLVSTLREAAPLSWEQFEANDFQAFFQHFGLEEWHGQYKRLATQQPEPIEEQPAAEPAAPRLPETPLTGGILSPSPMLDDAQAFSEPLTSERKSPDSQHETVRDAWLWLEKGHVERGLELFQTALDHSPEDSWLRAEYEKALAQYAPQAPSPERESPTATPETPAVAPPNEEAKSYELMGDMALGRGDYLFAKYCWDRVAEIEPAYPGIFRKLGLMTAEHLLDYRETAIVYLQKSLENQPDDDEVRNALGETTASLSTQNKTPEQVATTPVQEPLTSGDAPLAHQTQALVLITGATSGIGRATAEIFARHGYRLILTGRRVERLVELKNQFEAAFGSEVLLLPFDVRDPGAVEAALGNLPESFQEIDVLVNNAGLAKGLAPIHEGSLEHWETMIDTNIKGLLYVTRLVSPGMVKRRRGHIINVCSSAGREAYPKGNVYCATKFAVDALTKSMRFDLHAYNIRVGQVSPGHVEETEFAITRFDGDSERARIYDDFQPLKSSDVAEAIFFMATRPPHVNIQDVQMFATQQASSLVIDRSGR